MGWNKIRKIGGWWAKLLPTSSTCRVKTFVLFSAKPVPGQKKEKTKAKAETDGYLESAGVHTFIGHRCFELELL